jgi:Protein of unknown function (DUF3891)
MIVRKGPDGSLILIAQTNHAELSGLFAANWGNEIFARPHPHQSVVRAAIYHDAGWYKYEAQPFYDVSTKSTPNFVQVPPDPIQLEAYQWAIDWVSSIDPYAGLLVNRHRTGLWAERYHTVNTPPPPPRRPLSELVAKFMAHNETRQQHALQSIDRNEFAINYHMLQVWDLLSLYLCGGERKTQTFEPVPTGYDGSRARGIRMSVTPIDETRLSIEPYPFDVRPFRVCYAYKHVGADFPSEAAFLEAYYAAVPKSKYFEFV